jgi:hypothetical protein
MVMTGIMHGWGEKRLRIYYYYYHHHHYHLTLQSNADLRLPNDFSHSVLFLDLSFRFLILRLLKAVCTQLHHLFFGRPLSRLPWGLMLNAWFTFLLLTILLTDQYNSTDFDKQRYTIMNQQLWNMKERYCLGDKRNWCYDSKATLKDTGFKGVDRIQLTYTGVH